MKKFLTIIFILFFIFTINIYSNNLVVTTGYSYISPNNYASINYLPFLDINYLIQTNSTNFFFDINGFYTLNKLYNYKFNSYINYYKNKNLLTFYLDTNFFNLPTFSSNYETFFSTNFLFSYNRINNTTLGIDFYGQYKQFTSKNENNIFIALDTNLLNVSPKSHFELYLNNQLETDISFSSLYLISDFDFNSLILITTNQYLDINFNIENGYSLTNSQGNYAKITYGNGIVSKIKQNLSFQNKLTFSYKYFYKIINSSTENNNLFIQDSLILFFEFDKILLNLTNNLYTSFYPNNTSENYLAIEEEVSIDYILTSNFSIKPICNFYYQIPFNLTQNTEYIIDGSIALIYSDKRIELGFVNNFVFNYSSSPYNSLDSQIDFKYLINDIFSLNSYFVYRIILENNTPSQYIEFYINTTLHF